MLKEVSPAITEESKSADTRSVEVRLPASTSNLGAGFDCFGLALQLYLTVRASVDPESQDRFRIRLGPGKENAALPRTAENLVYRSIAYAAGREGQRLPAVRLAIDNEIPVSRGLGGSGAAIIAGIKLCSLLCDCEIRDEKVLQYATDFEGHAENVAATLFGGFIIACTSRQGRIIALKRPWPADIKIVVVVPESLIETKLARAALPRVINHADGVFNLQRVALFNAALTEHRYDLLWEAMQDRLHQAKRSKLVPGLAEALATQRMPGLLGVALSGAGPGILALAQDHFDEIGEAIAKSFRRHGIGAGVRQLEIDSTGCQSRVVRSENTVSTPGSKPHPAMT
jgi:homoserine kinase